MIRADSITRRDVARALIPVADDTTYGLDLVDLVREVQRTAKAVVRDADGVLELDADGCHVSRLACETDATTVAESLVDSAAATVALLAELRLMYPDAYDKALGML